MKTVRIGIIGNANNNIDNSIKVGIIGVGNIGSAHAMSIFSGNIQGLRLAAVCDIDASKREWAQEHFPSVPTFEQYGDMLNSGLIDAVIIATPHYLHPDMAIVAFEKSLHVLTEKPAGVYTNQVLRMNDAAMQAGTVFGIMFNQRTDPLFQKTREIVKNGQLGELKRFVWIVTNWYRTQAYYNSSDWRATWAGEGGGVLLNQAPHNLDLWQWIFGMPARIRAFCDYGKYHNIEVEDDVTIYAQYENGATAQFISTTGECPGTNRLEISGDRGKLVIEDGILRLWELPFSEREFCCKSDEGFAEPKTAYSEHKPETPGSLHNAILQNFADAILHGAELISPGIDGINQVGISNAAYLSDWTDDWVELPFDSDLYERMLKERADASAPHGTAKNKAPGGVYKKRWDVLW